MASTQPIKWNQVDRTFSGLSTDIDHEICVQREAIPLIFIPGIMGSRLRLAGTDGKGKGNDGLPKLRWDPGSAMWMLRYFSGADGQFRKRMLIGNTFRPDFLEVDNTDPIEDGFSGIMDDYTGFLKELKKQEWCGPLRKIFEFPVYAFGYNWTDSNKESGKKLAGRIKNIIEEGREFTGCCEKVILITHSMGGLVARWASEEADAKDNILGIIHGVQPTTGAAAAYWRMKAGFEGFGMTSRTLGNSARTVTPVLGNIPGGLELLPNKIYGTNDHRREWLTVTQSGNPIKPFPLPVADPYVEIYQVKAVVRPNPGERPSTNCYWGLVDPDLLDPGNVHPTQSESGPLTGHSTCNLLDAEAPPSEDPWEQYMSMLHEARSFHETLGDRSHENTFCFRGAGHHTADLIELWVQPKDEDEPYPKRGFRGFFTDAAGRSMMAVLQDSNSDGGDGTVPVSSASALDKEGKPFPADREIHVTHQPAYGDSAAQTYTKQAIIALCKIRFDALRSR